MRIGISSIFYAFIALVLGLVKYWQHGGAWCTNPELCRTNFGRQEGKVIISSDFGFRVAVKGK